MKVQMSSGVTDSQRASHSEASRPAPRAARSSKEIASSLLAGHPDHVLEQRQLVADRADLLQLFVVLDDRRPWRRSSRARTGTPRASWSGRSGRRSRRPRAPRSRSRSTRGGCWRGSRPCRPWRRRGRSGRARGRGRSRRPRRSCGSTHSSPSLKRTAGGVAVHLRRARQQVGQGARLGSPLHARGRV